MLQPPTLFTTAQASTPLRMVQLYSRVYAGVAFFEPERSAAIRQTFAVTDELPVSSAASPSASVTVNVAVLSSVTQPLGTETVQV